MGRGSQGLGGREVERQVERLVRGSECESETQRDQKGRAARGPRGRRATGTRRGVHLGEGLGEGTEMAPAAL